MSFLSLCPSLNPRQHCRHCQHCQTPSFVMSASGLTPGSGTASSTIRSLPVCAVVSRSSRGRIGRKCRTARRERAFIGPVTPSGVLSGGRGSGRAEPRGLNLLRSWEGSRRTRGHALPWPGSHPLLACWSRTCTGHMRRRRGLRQHTLDDDCCRETHRPRGRPRAFEQGLRSS